MKITKIHPSKKVNYQQLETGEFAIIDNQETFLEYNGCIVYCVNQHCNEVVGCIFPGNVMFAKLTNLKFQLRKITIEEVKYSLV